MRPVCWLVTARPGSILDAALQEAAFSSRLHQAECPVARAVARLADPAATISWSRRLLSCSCIVTRSPVAFVLAARRGTLEKQRPQPLDLVILRQ